MLGLKNLIRDKTQMWWKITIKSVYISLLNEQQEQYVQ